MSENFKIRMIRTPSYELEATFIVLDKFEPIQKDNKFPKYFMGCKLYEGKTVNNMNFKGKIIPFEKLELRYNGNNAIARTEKDVCELPTATEYMKFLNLMKQHKYFYNRKTHQLMKYGKPIS